MIEGGRSAIPFPQCANVLMHIECRNEIDQLIQVSERPGFVAAYGIRIQFLSQHLGKETIVNPAWFEVLRNARGMRSIHLAKFRNLRILYKLEERKAYLLLAFEERKGHRNTEYSRYIDTALERLSERRKML